MATDRKKRPHNQPRTASGAPAPELRRIPLPPLPVPGPARSAAGRDATTAGTRAPATGPSAHPTSPAPGSRGVTAEETELLISGPGHDDRTGARGVTILNELVDEIQKGLDSEITRHTGAGALAAYRQTVACSLVVAPDDASGAAAQPDSPDRRHE